jgi:hypothetical protein
LLSKINLLWSFSNAKTWPASPKYYASWIVLFPGAAHASITSNLRPFHLLEAPRISKNAGRELLKLCITHPEELSIINSLSLVRVEYYCCWRWYKLGIILFRLPKELRWFSNFRN